MTVCSAAKNTWFTGSMPSSLSKRLANRTLVPNCCTRAKSSSENESTLSKACCVARLAMNCSSSVVISNSLANLRRREFLLDKCSSNACPNLASSSLSEFFARSIVASCLSIEPTDAIIFSPSGFLLNNSLLIVSK